MDRVQRAVGPDRQRGGGDTDLPWVVQYVKRWLAAGSHRPSGSAAIARIGMPAPGPAWPSHQSAVYQ